MEVEQPVAPLSPSAEEAPTHDLDANGGPVEAPAGAGDAVDAPEEPAPEASVTIEEQPSSSSKPKAAISPDAKPLKKMGGSPPKVSTTKPGTTPGGAGTPSVRKVGLILYLHLPHGEFSLNLS
jgi:hypothetical protein